MNKAQYTSVKTESGDSGRYPLSTQTLDFIQSQILLLQKLALIGGGSYILKEPDGESGGIAVIDGEVIPLAASPVYSSEMNYVAVTETAENISADGVTYLKARVYRTAAYSADVSGDENHEITSFTHLGTFNGDVGISGTTSFLGCVFNGSITITGGNVTFENCTFNGPGPITITAGSVTFTGCTFNLTYDDTATLRTLFEVADQRVATILLTVTRCRFSGSAERFIYGQSSDEHGTVQLPTIRFSFNVFDEGVCQDAAGYDMLYECGAGSYFLHNVGFFSLGEVANESAAFEDPLPGS